MNWRERARPVIRRVIAENGMTDEKVLRRALREAYPFGERRYHPYKIWCSEVRRQLGMVKAIKIDPRQLGFEVGDV